MRHPFAPFCGTARNDDASIPTRTGGRVTTAVLAESLSRDFGSVRALDALSLAIPRGTVFGFLGPNGAGKTTTIRLLLGLIEPTAGRCETLGLDPQRDGGAVRRRAGALLEHDALYERLSAIDNLEFAGRIWGLDRATRNARAQELLERFGLWDRRNDPAGTWSRGMKRKLAVARTVLHRPELVFLDEPTAGLDPVATAALRDDLGALSRDAGVTIFLTTHNLDEAERLCDLIGVVRQGRLVALGSPDELRDRAGGWSVDVVATGLGDAVGMLELRPEVDSVRSTSSGLTIALKAGESSTAGIVSALVEGGARIEEVRKSKPTLEAVFLGLMSGAETPRHPGVLDGQGS